MLSSYHLEDTQDNLGLENPYQFQNFGPKFRRVNVKKKFSKEVITQIHQFKSLVSIKKSSMF